MAAASTLLRRAFLFDVCLVNSSAMRSIAAAASSPSIASSTAAPTMIAPNAARQDVVTVCKIGQSTEASWVAIGEAGGWGGDGMQSRLSVFTSEPEIVAGDYERFVEALTCRPGRVFADERGPKDLYSEDVEGLGLVGVAFSKIESRKIRRRLIAWHRARAESGKPAGGTRPFGWQEDRLTLEPVEAALLNKAGDEVIAGRSINSIILEWRERQILTSLGNLWTPRSMKVTLNNPRLCGWRRSGDDILRNEAGEPILGLWQPVMSSTKWLALHTVLDARKGKMRAPGETYRDVPPDFYETKYLLTGIARCGKPGSDGAPCGTPMRATHQRHCVQHIYICQPKSVGGCSGVGRRGDKVDEFVSEAILAKLEERTAVAERAPWLRAGELGAVNQKVQSLRDQWLAGGISDDFFYPTLQRLEQQRRDLRNDEAKHAATQLRAQSDLSDIRRRWYTDELDLSQKRALVKESLHAVIVHPVGPGGRGRAAFNPDLLELVWRQ
ncbi:hypothetical protein E0H58_38995 [Kribbella speibonae]|uniref:Recombinase domain-containing protein n=2 Tax=Kribbella speibonae TaxID=1572660 RepID=A0ABY1ZSJ4_9ACTN|nr:hypothetical protein E0H58_38995 [Kribbella speibonae]